MALKVKANVGLNAADSTRAVAAVFGVMKKALMKGKNVEIEGLGILTHVTYKQSRKLYRNQHGVLSIVTDPKQPHNIVLRKTKEIYA